MQKKPLKLMEELLEIHSNKGELVLDCFIGSGTTAIAAINTNRNYIGFEMDTNYFNLANERIERCLNPIRKVITLKPETGAHV